MNRFVPLFLLILIQSSSAADPVLEWRQEVPEDCPFEMSEDFAGVRFTGKHSDYNVGDTFYPTWASDGNLYSPWTDGVTDGVKVNSGGSIKAGHKTGHVVMIGEDPETLVIRNTSPPKQALATPYRGRYPAGSLVHDGIWYYGTYCLGPSASYLHHGLRWNWPVLGPVPGFQISYDLGKTWKPSPLSPTKPLFPEPAKFLGPVKMGAPHFVDYGRNMEHSPDGKAYLIAMGAEVNDPKPRPGIRLAENGKGLEIYEGSGEEEIALKIRPGEAADPELKKLIKSAYAKAAGKQFDHGNLSWISADQIYLARVTPSPETINSLKAYEFFAGHDKEGKPIWTNDFEEIEPLIEWNNHMGCVTATWVPGLQKYLMCVTDGWPTVTKMTSYILEADQLTGPWKMVAYMKDFGEQAYFLNIPTKFISDGGMKMWLCYSANFANEENGLLVEPMKIHPPGGRYGLSLHEMELIPKARNQ